MLQENGYIILNKIDNKFNTRETLTKKSILDHVSSNLKHHKFHMTIVESPMSDHKQIYFEVGKYTVEPKKKIKYHTIDYTALYQTVESTYHTIDYTALYQTVESTVRNISDRDYNSLEYMIKEAVNSNKIQKIKIQNTLKGDWINRDIIEMITKRNQLWSASKAKPDDDSIKKEFIALRNAVTEQIQCTKSSYYYKVFKACEKKPFKMWKLIENLAGNKTKMCSAPSKLDTELFSKRSDYGSPFQGFQFELLDCKAGKTIAMF
ncbi:unnamed protein product [Euphydryas editha]|uniref:Uncharacterized protein n=1 Tax=Euphydryas editha TaxID=104508 RepID=A0AAU9UHF9_EUPED|nr:unnamed protein product [Euphydryas editha]